MNREIKRRTDVVGVRQENSAPRCFLFLLVFADGGCAGDKLTSALARAGGPEIEIVKRPKAPTGVVVIARRWVVERAFAWFGRCRRLAKDWDASIASSDAWLLIASIRRMVRHFVRARKSRSEF